MQITVAYAIVSICECSGIFSFFQLCKFQETVLGKCVIFLMKSYVGQIIVCQCISFCISVRSKIQIFTEVTCCFLHPVQTIISFSSPINSIRLVLQIILSQGYRLVKVTDSFLELCIGKRLCTEMEQDFLFRLQNCSARVSDSFDGFQGGFVTAGIHVYLYQITADFVYILGIREFIKEFLENSNRFTESGIGGLVNTKGVIVSSLLFDLHICIGGSSLLKCHACLVLI